VTLLAPPVQAQGNAEAKEKGFSYNYVSLDAVELPPGFIVFFPVAINNSGRVYGVVLDDEAFLPHIAVYAQGSLTVFPYPQPTNAYAVNEGGTVGGSVVVDPVNFYEQAALFRGDQVELIPRLAGELTSFVVALNDPGMALVASYDASFQLTIVLYQNGKLTPLDFGPNIADPFFLGINNQGIISGTTFQSLTSHFRGFRFDYRTGKTTLLDPLQTESDSWALEINSRGDVLGYSFISSATERIGVWDKEGQFNTYFVEGTPEFPTISNRLLFNDNNLIVITFIFNPPDESGRSYLVPEPGVRWNLADLVENLPPGQTLGLIVDINNHGDMIGSGDAGSFLLERNARTVDITKPPAPAYGTQEHQAMIDKAKKVRELRKSWHPWVHEPEK
jgi:hypothetical protein